MAPAARTDREDDRAAAPVTSGSAAFAGLDACVAPVLAPMRSVAHPHLASRGVFGDVDGLVHPEPAPRLSRTQGARGTAAPLVGEHTEAVLADFGFSGSAVARLCQQGVIFQARSERGQSTRIQEQ